jgi:hypothetical protein
VNTKIKDKKSSQNKLSKGKRNEPEEKANQGQAEGEFLVELQGLKITGRTKINVFLFVSSLILLLKLLDSI